MQNKIKVAIVDDQQLVRDGITALLSEYSQFEIQHSANGRRLINSLDQNAPDVILLDIEMPEMGGFETTSYLFKYYPHIKIIILTGHAESELAFHMIFRGARAYLDKDIGIETIVEAIYAVLGQNGYYFNKYLSEDLLNEILDKRCTNSKPEFFTEREEDVLELICAELSNKEIADRLFISEKTVETHRSSLMRKTGKRNAVGLVAFNIRRNIWNKFWFKTAKK